MSAEENDESGLILLFQGYEAGISWDKRLEICEELLRLVESQHVRDVSKLPRKVYGFLLESIRLGWQHPEGKLQQNAQAAFAGLTVIPEFETDVAEGFVDDGFLLELCGRFQAGVTDEQTFLRDTLHWAYASFPRKRGLLRQNIGSVLGYFVRTPSSNFHVAEMLQVVRLIVKGFPEKLTKVHRSLLTGVLLPLHQPNQMAVWSLQQPLLERYHEALVGCLVPFLEREPDLVLLIFEAIAEAWPSGFNSNTPKEVLLLHELEILIKFVPPEASGAALDVIMPKVLGCLQVENSRVVERALFLFKDETFLKTVARNSQAVFLPLVAALLRGGEPFWNPTVTKMTAHVLESLAENDGVAFTAACESLWGDGAPLVASAVNDPTTPRNNRQAPSQPGMEGSSNLTSLKGAMGNWRPTAGIRTGRAGASQAARNPPAAVTGVAPWAFQAPKPSTRPRPASLSPPAATGTQRTPPTHSLKKMRLGAPGPAKDDGDGDAANVQASTDTPVPPNSSPRSSSTGGNTVSLHAVDEQQGEGLRKVREFIAKLKPKEDDESSGPLWHEIQLEPTPTLLPDLRFHDLVFGHELGQGSFSVVKYARQISKGKSRSQWPEFAVKVVSTTKIQELNYEKSVTNEIACLRMFSHPGIARLVSAFRWRDGAYLVLEYASRGDLHSHVKQHGSLSEASTRFVVGEVVAALCSIHDCGFVFGDLKPENILITESGHIKIADFGACRPLSAEAKKILHRSRDALRTLRDGDWRVAAGLPPDPLYTTPAEQKDSDSDSDSDSDEGVGEADPKREESDNDEQVRAEGTAAYMPPEVARGGTPGLEADAWALGCVTFLCLAGRPPIFAETDEGTMARVVRFAGGDGSGSTEKDNDLPPLPIAVSDAPRVFVRVLMEPDPKIRISMAHAAKHEFLVQGGVDVFSLHRQKPVELAQGTVAPTPNAAWSRRQNSMIWAPMPQEYRFDAVSRELVVIPETEVECKAAFRRHFGAILEPPVVE